MPADPAAETTIVPLGNGSTSSTGVFSPVWVSPEETEGVQDIVMLHSPVRVSKSRMVESYDPVRIREGLEGKMCPARTASVWSWKVVMGVWVVMSQSLTAPSSSQDSSSVEFTGENLATRTGLEVYVC